ncbi:hypothetical protein D3C71_2115670 [compost metagenome]
MLVRVGVSQIEQREVRLLPWGLSNELDERVTRVLSVVSYARRIYALPCSVNVIFLTDIARHEQI